MNLINVSRRPSIAVADLSRRAASLPTINAPTLNLQRFRDVGAFWIIAMWISANLYALTAPLGLILELSKEAWAAISALIGIAGTILTTLIVKRYDKWIASKQDEAKSAQELLKQTIDWAVKERQELYLESEKSFRERLALKDQTIAELREENARLKNHPPPKEKEKT